MALCYPPPHKSLTHWGRVTHICVDKLIINGLSPGVLLSAKSLPFWPGLNVLTHSDLVMRYGINDLSVNWLRLWLVAWRYQAISWTNVDLSFMEYCDIHLQTI